MADYVYRISVSGTATGADAGFTTVNAAVADAVANDRTGSGVAGRVAANSTIFFRIDGFLSLADVTINGIDTTTNSNAAIVVEDWSNPWNASTSTRLGYVTSFDGIDMGGSATANFGTGGSRQANITVRDLVIRTGVGGGFVTIHFGPSTGAISNYIERCVLAHTGTGNNSRGVQLDAAGIRNCLVLLTGNGWDLVENIGRASANPIDQCTFIGLGTIDRFCNNQNDPLPLVRNTYIGASFTNFSNSGTWSSSCVGNATDRSAWTGPTGTLFSVALSTTNFENVTSSTEDFRVKAASVLATTGATRLSGITTDAYNTARQDPTTIGAHEILGGPAGPTGSFTLDDFAFTGTLASAPASSLLGTLTLDNFVLSGTLGLLPGRVDTPPFKNWTGTLLPGVTVPNVVFLRLDRTTALALASQTTAGDAVMTVENAALVAGTSYVMVTYNADGTTAGAQLVVAA
jgi:hypothetical protein